MLLANILNCEYNHMHPEDKDMGVTSLSIVFPMYNEKGNIEVAVRDALIVGYKMAPEVEVIIVDDASNDGSGETAECLADKYPEVRVLHNPRNMKLGATLRRGFSEALNEWILYMDSDLPFPMHEALNALPFIQGADMIIGWRISRMGSMRRDVMSFAYNQLVRCCFGLRVKDVNFAFKLFRRTFYRQIKLISNGSFIDAELILEMERHGARIKEIPMSYCPRVAGVSTLSSWSVVWKILEEMTYYRVHNSIQQRSRRATDNPGGEC